jgi:hypothetical protein
MPALDALVLRLSSLGDVVLAGRVTGGLGRVGFVTEPRYTEIVSRFTGVEAVFHPGDTLPEGIRRIDLQGAPKSRWFGADRRVARHDLRRWGRVWWKGAPGPPVAERYGVAAGVRPAAAPWLPAATPGDALVIAPGAAHRNKRWWGWEALAARWPGPVRAIGGPGDEAALAPLGGAAESGFAGTFSAFQGAAVVVAGDTGLLHLAAAVGLPVVGIFGPTTSSDGFWGHAGEVVELPLACRPCGKHGGDACPVGDHACLRGITIDAVLAACRRQAATRPRPP